MSIEICADLKRPRSRRQFVQSSLAGTMGVWGSCLGTAAFSALGQQVALAAEKKKPPKACILLWMSGGPSQLETLDPKPGHENGGPTESIKTSVPGIHLSANLPLLAEQMKDVALIRSMKTREGDHARATQLIQTGYRPMGEAVEYPVLGSMVAHRLKPESSQLPGFVSIAPMRGGGAGFLGPQHTPLIVSGNSQDPNARANLTVENLSYPGMSESSLKRRQSLLETVRGGLPASNPAIQKHISVYEQAIEMVKTQAQGAFNLSEEPEQLRDAYGRNRFGQGCLLARRLVERGVSCVEVTLANAGQATWDSHQDNFSTVRTLCETLDPGWSTLLRDLRDRGLLESTLVVWMGEFGRTPTINGSRGRDHFPNAWSTALAGAGLTGTAFGSTSDGGEEVIDQPVSASDLMATVLTRLGIDASSDNYDGDRPIPIVDEGTPIEELTA